MGSFARMALNLHCHISSSSCNGRSSHQIVFCLHFHGQSRSFKPYLAWKHHQLFANASSFYHFMAVSRLKGLRRSPQYQPFTISMAQTELGDIPDDYYAVLGVPSDATMEEIKKAYYSCMKACHPDLSGDDPDTTIFCMFINEVYEVLSDPVQRMVYDEINGYSLKATNPFLDSSKPREHCFVDEFSCIGCKNCSNIAPLTFEIEEEFGRARVVSQSGERQLVQQAIDTCPVDCIHWVSAAQLSLLEDEMRKIERVNVGLMLSGMGYQMPDIFEAARRTWDKRQARVFERDKMNMMRKKNKGAKSPSWQSFWDQSTNNDVTQASDASEKAAKAAAAARRWREYSRKGVDRRPIYNLPQKIGYDDKEGDNKSENP